MDTVLSAVTDMAGTKDLAAIFEKASTMPLDKIIDAVTAYCKSQGWSLTEVVQTLWDTLPDSVQAAVADAVGGMTLEDVVAAIEDGSITLEDAVKAVDAFIQSQGITVEDALAALKKHCPEVHNKFF